MAKAPKISVVNIQTAQNFGSAVTAVGETVQLFTPGYGGVSHGSTGETYSW